MTLVGKKEMVDWTCVTKNRKKKTMCKLKINKPNKKSMWIKKYGWEYMVNESKS